MANKHYKLNKEIDVTLNVRVTLTGISDYKVVDDERQTKIIEEFREEIGNALSYKMSGDHQQQDLLLSCDFVDYYVATCSIDTEGIDEEEAEVDEEPITIDLDNDPEYEGMSFNELVKMDDEDEEVYYVIYGGQKYIMNSNYTVKEFVKEYGMTIFYDISDRKITEGYCGFAKKVIEIV
jgi:hypothetical protein